MAHHSNRHLLGQAGTGQYTLMTEWALNDIVDGNAVVVIDTTGTLSRDILRRIPKSRAHDVIDYNPARYSIPFNPLITDTPTLTADTLATAIKYGFGLGDFPTARMTGLLYNLLIALIEAKQGLFGMFLMLDSSEYRMTVLQDVSDPVVQRYWHWYNALQPKAQFEERSSTYNKVQVLMADPRIRAISGTRSAFDLKDMVKDKILILRLYQGEFGVEKSVLLANIWQTLVYQARLSTDTSVPMSLYIGDFYRLDPITLKDILATGDEANMSLTVANHYFDQVEPSLMDSLSANAEQYIFRVSPEDGKRLPPVAPQEFQLYETLPYEYVHFNNGTYSREQVSAISHPRVPVSAGKIRDRMKRNLHSPSTAEIDALLKNF